MAEQPVPIETVFKAEAEITGKPVYSPDTVGLALSGGGIRSASFCLGVIEALWRAGKIDRFDYLSTVSGGGYAGSALTWLIHHDRLAELHTFLDRLRSNGNYLDPGQRLTGAALIAVVLRTVTVNLLVYGGVLVGILYLLYGKRIFPHIDGQQIAWELAEWLTIGFAAASILYAILTGPAGRWLPINRYLSRLRWQMAGGTALGLIALLVVIGALPGLHYLLSAWLGTTFSGTEAGIVSLVSGWFAAAKSLGGSDDKQPSALSKLIAPLAAIAAVIGVLLTAYDIATNDSLTPIMAGGLVVVALLIGGLTDLNLISLHRMYRDRLMEAFLPNPDAIGVKSWQAATEANVADLEGFKQRPYHLINTNIVLIDSKNTQIRGRGGDNFILSPLYSGSSATWWNPTRDIMGKNGKDGLSLPTAVAISGAAVNAHVGADAQPGLLRNGAVAFLLSLFGLQLGAWVSNPTQPLHTPNFWEPGLKSLLGFGFKGKSCFNLLTDGGHFENLGLYELIRRKVRTIVAIDGGCDPDFTFADLSALVEKARVDFGATIGFTGNGTLVDLKPEGHSQDFPSIPVAKRGWIEGVITYDDGSTARLYYVKSTLIDGISPDVYGYKAANPTFPHQTTADQFFDEFQLESYVTLGNAIGDNLAKTAII